MEKEKFSLVLDLVEADLHQLLDSNLFSYRRSDNGDHGSLIVMSEIGIIDSCDLERVHKACLYRAVNYFACYLESVSKPAIIIHTLNVSKPFSDGE